MFTGLIQSIGTVSSSQPRGGSTRLVISAPSWRHRHRKGDSICVSGCCLTLVQGGASAARGRGSRTTPPPLVFDVVAETLRRTTLGGLRPGDTVNLEHALTPATLMGGHFVQGHVDGLGRVLQVQTGDDWRVRIEPGTGVHGEPLMNYLVPKGSVCVDGVSLTIAALSPPQASHSPRTPRGWFEVALIPTTLRLTTLNRLKPGAGVNIEADLISKTIVHWLERTGPQRIAPVSKPKRRRPAGSRG